MNDKLWVNWRGCKKPAGMALLLYGVLASAPANAAAMRIGPPAKPPQILDDKSSMIVSWVPITYQKDTIVKVGAVPLPLPLALPNHIKPLGNKALLWTRPHEKGPNFWIFFGTRTEASIKQWASGLPKDFPLPAGTYQLPKGIKHRDLPQAKRWVYSANTAAYFGTVSFVCTGGPKEIKDATYAKLPYVFQHLLDVKSQPGSPIAHESRWISQFIGFESTKAKK